MTYRPDAARYQQLVYGGPTGPFDCTAWVAAWLVDAHTLGKTKTTGRAIRLASSEPIPDPDSPGLNEPQVDAAAYRVTAGKVNLTLGGTWTPTMDVQKATTWVLNGRPVEVQVNRGQLIDLLPALGALNGFRGGHAIGVITNGGTPWIFDPLAKIYIPATFAIIWRAAGALDTGSHTLGHGYANVLAARDIIPSSYHVDIDPGHFNVYRTDAQGHIAQVKAASVAHKTTRLVERRTQLWFPAFKSYRNVARLIEGALAKTEYHWINLDSKGVHYRETLP
jgi:hypothetical protein